MFRRSDFAAPLALVALLAVFFYSERVTDRTQPSDRVQVQYWEKWTGSEFDAMKAVVDDFNASQDRITVNILPVSQIDQKTMMASSAGIPPDVAGLFGPNVPQYADDNAILPLDDFCRQAGIREEDYVPSYWGIATYNQRIYALPSAPASMALHYNVEMLKQAGFSKPPRTIEELDRIAEALTKRDANGTITVTGFMHAEPGWWNWAWGAFFGARLWDGEDKITPNSPENVRAMEWVASYAKKYGKGALQTFKSGFGNFSSPQNAFMSRKVAMQLQGVWMHNFISQFAKDLPWAAAPFPHPEDRPDLEGVAIVDLDVLVIPKDARHPREAFEFIRYVQTQKAMEKLCLGQQKNSPLRKVSDEFWEMHGNPYIRLFHELANSKNAISTPRIGIWTMYNRELAAAFDEVSLLRKTPQQALDDVAAKMQPEFEDYRKALRAREAATR